MCQALSYAGLNRQMKFWHSQQTFPTHLKRQCCYVTNHKWRKTFLEPNCASSKLYYVILGKWLNLTHCTPELTTVVKKKKSLVTQLWLLFICDCYYKSKVYSNKNDINRNNSNCNMHQILSYSYINSARPLQGSGWEVLGITWPNKRPIRNKS